MYSFPSTSTSVEPDALAIKRGEPPTDLNARTGLSTPPGNSCCARENRRSDRFVFTQDILSRVDTARSPVNTGRHESTPVATSRDASVIQLRVRARVAEIMLRHRLVSDRK